MKLRFYARPGNVVNVPGLKRTGTVYQYVGRRTRPAKDAAGNIVGYSHAATEAPAVFDSNSAEGQRMARLCARDAALWAADRETAKACGVKFQQLELRQDEWHPVSKKVKE